MSKDCQNRDFDIIRRKVLNCFNCVSPLTWKFLPHTHCVALVESFPELWTFHLIESLVLVSHLALFMFNVTLELPSLHNWPSKGSADLIFNSFTLSEVWETSFITLCGLKSTVIPGSRLCLPLNCLASKHWNYRAVNKTNRFRGQVLIHGLRQTQSQLRRNQSVGSVRDFDARNIAIRLSAECECEASVTVHTPDPASASIFKTRLRGLQRHYYSDQKAGCLPLWHLIIS